MHILLVDYGGYPFTLELARELGSRGHGITYAFRDGRRLRDILPGVGGPASLEGSVGVSLVQPMGDVPLEKANLIQRRALDRAFGRHASALLGSVCPDVTLSANMPLDAQRSLLRASKVNGSAFVYWLQDFIGEAMRVILPPRLGPLGRVIASRYAALEGRLLRQSDAVIAISEGFKERLAAVDISVAKVEVLGNWAPIREIPALPRDNAWSREQGWRNQPVILYAGALGMKQDPKLLLDLAADLRRDTQAQVVVVAEGDGAEWLRLNAAARGADNLHVLPFQSRARLPEVLATADVLIALLKSDASGYSVPSKVLSYLCAGRPIVAVVPEGNGVAELVRKARAGVVCPVADVGTVADVLRRLLNDSVARRRMGRSAREHAESVFDESVIATRFEVLLERVRSDMAPHSDTGYPS